MRWKYVTDGDRQLITHSSGFGYDKMDPKLNKWRALQGVESGTRGLPMLERCKVPLLFEPGTSWSYGMGIDWAGILVMRLNNMNFEEYMQKNIWDPLDIKNITFHQELKPNVSKNLVKMAQRSGIETPAFNLPADNGMPVEWSDIILYDNPIPMGEEYGGQGAIGNAVDYMEILKSILKNDGKLLKPTTVDLIFEPQLGPESKTEFNNFLGADMWKGIFTSHSPGQVVTYGLTGEIIEKDEATGRKKGTLGWSGLPNLLWTIDREAGLACFYAGNLIPFGDQASHRVQQMFEKEMYDRLKSTLAA